MKVDVEFSIKVSVLMLPETPKKVVWNIFYLYVCCSCVDQGLVHKLQNRCCSNFEKTCIKSQMIFKKQTLVSPKDVNSIQKF